MSYQVENNPQCCVWGGRRQLLQSVKLGLIMASWHRVIVCRWKMQVVQILLQRFWGFGKISLWWQQNATDQLKSWQRVTALKTGNAKFSSVYFSLCANIVECKSEMCYNFIDCCYVSVDCTLQRSRNLQPFSAAGREGGQVQIWVQGKTNKKGMRKGRHPEKNDTWWGPSFFNLLLMVKIAESCWAHRVDSWDTTYVPLNSENTIEAIDYGTLAPL